MCTGRVWYCIKMDFYISYWPGSNEQCVFPIHICMYGRHHAPNMDPCGLRIWAFSLQLYCGFTIYSYMINSRLLSNHWATAKCLWLFEKNQNERIPIKVPKWKYCKIRIKFFFRCHLIFSHERNLASWIENDNHILATYEYLTKRLYSWVRRRFSRKVALWNLCCGVHASFQIWFGWASHWTFRIVVDGTGTGICFFYEWRNL